MKCIETACQADLAVSSYTWLFYKVHEIKVTNAPGKYNQSVPSLWMNISLRASTALWHCFKLHQYD